MRRKISLVVALAAVLLLSASGPASANHPGCYVDGLSGWYTDNQELSIGHAWINWGAWDSTADYIARRYDQYWNETYNLWRPGGGPIHWASTSGNELLYRATSQQRAGYGWRQFGFSTYHCDPR